MGDEATLDHSDEVAYAQNYISRELPDLPATKSIDCPSHVDAKAGNTFECQATLANGQEVTLPFRILSASDNHASFATNFAQVSPALATDVMYQAGASSGLQSADCPSGVPATAGKTFDCQAHLKSGRTLNVTLRVGKATATNQPLVIVRTS